MPRPAGADHPRIRGEHVDLPTPTNKQAGSSPHTRGAPIRRAASTHARGIIPAYAGSTPGLASPAPPDEDHPRIRGEHSRSLSDRSAHDGSSPHTRGAPSRIVCRAGGSGIIPAYAGSTPGDDGADGDAGDHPRIRGEHWAWSLRPPRSRGSSPHTRGAPSRRGMPRPAGADHPRIRGEHVDLPTPTNKQAGSSPHTRGAPIRRAASTHARGIIPAYAGSTLSARTESRSTSGSSPHTRGALGRLLADEDAVGIIPAYAGSTGVETYPIFDEADHPRIRGEHTMTAHSSGAAAGSSPHTRGALPSPCVRTRASGIIPAYAGSTPNGTGRAGISRDHPRIRGEHDYAKRAPAGLKGSSPHTRGAPGRTAAWIVAPWDHPRIRGEHEGVAGAGPVDAGSSPHTRGAQVRALQGNVQHGIIPAYAGSTRRWRLRRTRSPDHPRIRGEHTLHSFTTSYGPGSSPHTRGAHEPEALWWLRSRIIPAYAGSTLESFGSRTRT